jgi:hypothetical protein
MSDPHVVEINVENLQRMPPPPPDYVSMLAQMRHVLRGTQAAIQNQMVPEHLTERIYSGCIGGLIAHLDSILPMPESQIEVVLQAVMIQRAVLNRPIV